MGERIDMVWADILLKDDKSLSYITWYIGLMEMVALVYEAGILTIAFDGVLPLFSLITKDMVVLVYEAGTAISDYSLEWCALSF